MALNGYGLGFQLFADDQASKVFDKVAGKVGGLEKDTAAAATSMQQASSELTAMGSRFSAVSAGIQTFLMGAAHEANLFGKSVAEVASITDRAAFPISEIERIGKEMASTYGGDLNQQVKTLYQAASSGASNAAEAATLMHAANKLAVGGLSDSFKAVDALTNVLNAYGMKMSEADAVSDAMFTTAKIGKTTIDELATQIGRVAPTAAAMGVSMDDMMSVVTAASSQLGNGAAAIDGLKEALAGFKSPSADASAEAQRLGIKFDQATLQSIGFEQMLKNITTSSKYNAQTMGKLFGSMTAFNTMSALAANGGKGFADALEGMRNKAGSTDKAFATLAETGAFAETVLKANFQTALVSIGQAITPLVSKITLFVNRILVGFNRMSPTIQKTVTWIGVAIGAFTGVIGAVLGTAGAIASLVVAGKALLIGLAATAGTVLVLAAVFIPLIAAGAALHFMWTKNVGGIADKVAVWFKKIELAFTALQQVFETGGFSESLLTQLNDGNEGIKAFAINAFLWFNRIKNFFSGIGDAFTAGMQRVGPVVERISAAIGRLAARFSSTTASAQENKGQFEAWGAVGARVGNVLARIVEVVAIVFEKVVGFIDGAVASFQKFQPVIDQVWDATKGVGKAFGELFSALLGGGPTVSTSAETWNKVGQVFGQVAGVLLTQMVSALRMVAGWISFVSGVVGGLHALFAGVFDSVVIGVQLVAALLRGDFQGAWVLAEKWVQNWANTILAMFSKVVGGAAGMIDSLGKVFGKDLGLKAKVEGFAAPAASATAPAPLPAPAAGSGAANPATAQAGASAAGMAALAGAVSAAPAAKQPDINLKTQLTVDGRVLAEVVQKQSAQDAFRSGAPTPSPT